MTAGRTVTFTDKNYLENEFIDLASAPSDEYLRGDATWQTAATIVGAGGTISNMSDVTITSLTDGDILTYDTTSSNWKNEQGSSLASSIGLGSTSNPTFNQLTLTGNLTVQGVTTTVDSTTLTVVDPIITLQTASGGGALSADSNKDVGIAMQYHTGSAAKTAFLGFDDSEGKLTFIPDATITSEITSGTKGTIVANLEGNVTGNAGTVTNGLYTTNLGVSVQAYDADLTALAGLTSAADKGIQFTGSGTAGTFTLTTAGKALLDDANASTQRTTLGVDPAGTDNSTDVTLTTVGSNYLSIVGQAITVGTVPVVLGGTGATTDSGARTALGLAIGTDVQAYDADLTALAGLTSAADKGIQFTGSGTAAVYDLTTAGKALLDDADAAAQRTTLGVDPAGTDNSTNVTLTTVSSNYLSLSGQAITVGTVPVVLGGTGATTDSGARTALGLIIGTDVQAYDADLTALAGLTSAADKGIQFTGSGTAGTFTLTTAGKALLDDANASTQRTTLGLAIGTDVQAYDADLTALAGLTSAADKGIQFTGSGTAGTFTLTTAGKALLDDANASTQRTTLGLGTLATVNNITTSEIAATTLITKSEGVVNYDNDTTIPTTGAAKDYTDAISSAMAIALG